MTVQEQSHSRYVVARWYRGELARFVALTGAFLGSLLIARQAFVMGDLGLVALACGISGALIALTAAHAEGGLATTHGCVLWSLAVPLMWLADGAACTRMLALALLLVVGGLERFTYALRACVSMMLAHLAHLSCTRDAHVSRLRTTRSVADD